MMMTFSVALVLLKLPGRAFPLPKIGYHCYRLVPNFACDFNNMKSLNYIDNTIRIILLYGFFRF